MAEMSKDARIKKELNKLKKLFKDIDDSKKKLCEQLVESAAFMAVTLQDLQKEINLKGCISEYQNGANQWGTKKSPEFESYNSLIKNYSAIIRQLNDLLPDGVKVEDDGFDAFISQR